MSKLLAHCSKSKRKLSDDCGRNIKHKSNSKKSPLKKTSTKQKSIIEKQASEAAEAVINDDESTTNDKPLGHILHISDNDDELDNEELDSANQSDSEEEGAWQVKKSGRARPSTKQSSSTAPSSFKLPAIKLFISTRAIDSFKSPIAIAKEIDKCMGSNKLQLKFASIKGNLLTMATDDPATHERLNGPWPDNAFIHGVKPLVSTKKASIHTIIVKGVDPSVDLSDDYLVEQLRSAGLTLVNRIFNKKTNTPTSIVKLTTCERLAYRQAISQGVRIGYQTFKAEPEHRVLQCFKCQKPGHSAWSCANAQVCLKCSGQHRHQDCNATVLKCANCNLNHAACSRQCKELSNQVKTANKPRNKSYATVVSNSSDVPTSSKSSAMNNQLLDQVKDFITTSIEARIREMTTIVINHITEVLSASCNQVRKATDNNNCNQTNTKTEINWQTKIISQLTKHAHPTLGK